MIRMIDKTETDVIFKIVSPKGESRGYRVFPVAKIGDTSSGKDYTHLSEARAAIGKGVTQQSAK